MSRFVQTTVAILVLAVGLACAGCGKQRKLVVGRIDTAVILHSDPDYQTLAIQYFKQQTTLRRKFIDELRKAKSDKALQELARHHYQMAEKGLDEKWVRKTRKFLVTRHSAIKASVAQICKAKKIDMVLIDSKFYPTVEWGAVDITPDVQLKLEGGNGTSGGAS